MLYDVFYYKEHSLYYMMLSKLEKEHLIMSYDVVLWKDDHIM